MTHDIDQIKKTYQFLTYGLRALKRKDIKNFSYHVSSVALRNHYWTFDKIADIEKKKKVKSTFFFMTQKERMNPFKPYSWSSFGFYDTSNPRIVDVIKKLDKGGWEIGLQASSYSGTNKDQMRKEKEKLETVLGKKVVGVRHHLLRIDEKTTWNIHSDVGFQYDSSFGFKDALGFRDGICKPFKPLNGNSFVVIPIALMDIILFKISKDREDAWERCLKIIDEVEDKHAVLNVLWHNSSFNEDEYPYLTFMYEKIIDECKKRGAMFATSAQIANSLR